MADTKFSGLPVVSVPTGSDQLPVNQGGVSKSLTIGSFPDGVGRLIASTTAVCLDGDDRTSYLRITMTGTGRLAIGGTGRQMICGLPVNDDGLTPVPSPLASDFFTVTRATGARASMSLAQVQGNHTYYISPTGNDSTGDGSIINPWATIGKLYQNLTSPGDVGYLRGGVYTSVSLGAYVVTTQGSAQAPITVRNYPGETPILDGFASGTYNSLGFDYPAQYHVVDGITFRGMTCTTSAIIYFGQSLVGVAHHITVQRCTFIGRPGLSSLEHGVYLSQNSGFITIGGAPGMGNTFRGDYPHSTTGAAVEVYHTPGSGSANISFNAIDGWNQGVQIADPATTAHILHNTFSRCYNKVYVNPHYTLLIRDNVGDAQQNTDIYDPVSSAFTTADHNYWSQTISSYPDYDIASGGGGVLGAYDGASNAGWRPLSANGSAEDVVGAPRLPIRSFRVPDGYAHDVLRRLQLAGTVRASLYGTADLFITDDFGQRSRIVLAGRGF